MISDFVLGIVSVFIVGYMAYDIQTMEIRIWMLYNYIVIYDYIWYIC
jgi:hypothetical protein